MQTNPPIVHNESIDLYELWITLAKRKLTILTITTITTISALIYAYTATPVYHGKVLIEVGEVVNNHIVNNQIVNNSQPTTIFALDNINNLKMITAHMTGLNVEIPNNVTNILSISGEHSDKNILKSQLQKAVDYIMVRHQNKAKLYANATTKIEMTHIVGEISISDQPVKPKKQLIIIVAFISGLILGIFLVFFREFILNEQQPTKQ